MFMPDSNNRGLARAALTVAVLAFSLQLAGAQTFVDVTTTVGLDVYLPQDPDVAVAWGDYDNNDDVDLYLGAYDFNQGSLYYNDGTGFAQLDPGPTFPGLFVDYNNDGRLDIAYARADGQLYRGLLNGWFAVTPVFDPHDFNNETATFGDFDGDGRLDSYRPGWNDEIGGEFGAPDALFLNDRYRHMNKTLMQTNVADWRPGRSAITCDFDQDGDLDIYVCNYSAQNNYLWVNDGRGTLVDEALSRGVAADKVPYSPVAPGGNSIGAAWGDLDNDGLFDLVVANLSHGEPEADRPIFYRNRGAAGGFCFEDVSDTVALPETESYASPALADFDNDGDLDVFITAVSGAGYPGQASRLMRNDGGWSFTDVSATYGLALATAESNFGAAWADYDNDGDPDLFTDRRLFENPISNGHHWLLVKLVGDGDHVPRQPIGAQVRIDLGDQIVARQVETSVGWGNQNDPRLHFGLGTAVGPVDLEITWPNGHRQLVEDVAVDQIVEVEYDLTYHVVSDAVVFRPNTRNGQANWLVHQTRPGPIYFDDPDGLSLPDLMVHDQILTFGNAVSMPLVGDVDGNGFDDLVFVDASSPANYVWAAAHTGDDGNGNGVLAGAGSSSIGAWGGPPGAVFLADTNGDGAEDCIVALPGAASVVVWQALHSGPTGIYGGGTSTLAEWGFWGDKLFVGDFDGDGIDDIGAYQASGDVGIRFGTPAGLSNSSGFVVGNFASADTHTPLVGDFDGDGRDDVAFYSVNEDTQLVWEVVYATAGGQIDAANAAGPVIFGTTNDIPFVADINGDGLADIGFRRVDPGTDFGMYQVGFTDGLGQPYALGEPGDDYGQFGFASMSRTLFAQLDASDNRADIVEYRATAGQWEGTLNRGAASYLDGTLDEELPFGNAFSLPLLGDVDGDGVDDIVTATPNGERIPKYRWDAAHSAQDFATGTGSFSTAERSTVFRFGRQDLLIGLFLADINNDNVDDMVAVNNSYGWAAGFSVPGFGLSRDVVFATTWGAPGEIPLVGDFNGDGWGDICAHNPTFGHWLIALTGPAGFGNRGLITDGIFGGGTPLVGDVNGDGRADGLLTYDDGDGQRRWRVAYADPNGRIDEDTEGASLLFGAVSDTPLIMDVNGDGRVDVGVVYDDGAGSLRWEYSFTDASGVLGGGVDQQVDVAMSFGTAPSGDIGGVSDAAFAMKLQRARKFVLGDQNDDSTVDGLDLLPFGPCLAGPQRAVPGGCEQNDLDLDADVDLADFGRFQRQTGRSSPW